MTSFSSDSSNTTTPNVLMIFFSKIACYCYYQVDVRNYALWFDNLRYFWVLREKLSTYLKIHQMKKILRI